MEKEELLNLTVLITSKCSLKCRLCATYTPYCSKSENYSYERITKSVSKFFENIEHVGLFTISGGEPLLHPQLSELVDFFSAYIDRIDVFEIFTNGTIIPTGKLLEHLKFSNKVDVLIDDYGPELSPNVTQIANVLSASGIKHRVRKYYGENAHLGGWIDVSDFSEKHRTDKENENIFRRCSFSTTWKNLIILIDGTIHMCYVNNRLLDFVPDKPDEYIDLLDNSLSNLEIKERILNLRNRKSLAYCSHCNGFCEDAKRYNYPEQL
jgi:MoaA/NifB/PqqE/SkfB family radical SAM enzyme